MTGGNLSGNTEQMHFVFAPDLGLCRRDVFSVFATYQQIGLREGKLNNENRRSHRFDKRYLPRWKRTRV